MEEGLEEWKQDERMSEEAWALVEEKEDGSLEYSGTVGREVDGIAV